MQDIVKTLTWTFIHSLWQGLLAALLAAIIISSTRRARASLRYNLLSMVMILFFISSFVTFIIQADGTLETPVAASSVTSKEVLVSNSTGGLMQNFTSWVNTNSNMIMVGWMFFFLCSCLRLVTGLAAVNRLKYHKTYPVSTEWNRTLEELKQLIGVRSSVSLLQSGLVKVPMALGILKPVILLPAGLITHLPIEQVETILLHELAHIRRKDYLVNLLQHIIEAIFFFNPAIRWISSLIREEREASCDDMVVARCKLKTNYLNALISFQEYSFGHNAYAMGISGRRQYLLNRVKRMITNKNKGINFFEKIALLSGVILFSAFTYVIKETTVSGSKVTVDSVAVQQQGIAVLPIVETKPVSKNEKKKRVNFLNRPTRDTVPAKKTVARDRNAVQNKKPTAKAVEQQQAKKDANATLEEIIQLKNEIGIQKETIGTIKEQLKTKEGQEKETTIKELQRERRELDDKRKILDAKRLEWDQLKEKAKEKQLEERHDDPKKVIEPGKSSTIKNRTGKLRVESDKWDEPRKRIEPDKPDEPNKWNPPDKPNEPDKWDEHDKKVGKKPVITEYKFDIDNNKVNSGEFQYQLKFEQKDPPPAKEPAAAGKIKSPVTPPKKAPPARPGN